MSGGQRRGRLREQGRGGGARPRAGRRARAAVGAALLLAAVATGCGGGSDPQVPRGWIASTYEPAALSGNADYRDPVDAPARVADEIEGERGARDRIDRNGMVFLRYDEDLVAVIPHSGGGSGIDIEPYATGRTRYSAHVAHRWPAGSGTGEEFRGGGPGSGK
ncbi:DUF4247 domain-containing protein [Streptomyces sp. DSM 44917]|uniref:DUF4247 domain-containing protein n=1 Tax=Streptomyces boetiae TaxID=3075541 RepID=A0ABU2LBG3_9ACTN|nr:DUF4247 domain-containing protein [Streptomyces sp. DSM 44917]MDT0308647.1 DUF4247 domain-containing protein [Streptomyces sp. DSM 44917]